jgi:hypothetical protein
MNKTIYKYKLDFSNSCKRNLSLPSGSDILSCQLQQNEIMIWVLIDLKKTETNLFYFEIFGTGHEVGCDMGISRKFLNTVQFSNGLVFHIFQRLS